MSNWKNRMDMSTRSTMKSKNLGKSKSQNETNIACNRLPGIDEMAHSESGGVRASGSAAPFILVDSMCTRNRQQLHVALSKCEKRRMKWIQRQCCVLPLLKYMKPATRAEPTTAAEREERDELDFQEDLKQICIAELSVGDTKDRTGTVTPIAHAASTEDLLQNKPRLDEIRCQLEELRINQEAALSSVTANDQPKLLRQGTFDVKRDECLTISSSSSSIGSFKGRCSMLKSPDMIQSVTMSQSRINSVQPRSSTTCLFKNKSYTLLPESKKTNRIRCSETSDASEMPKIINQIGDLILQLPLQQQEDKHKLNNGSFAYLVTITPTADSMDTMLTSSKHSSKAIHNANSTDSYEPVPPHDAASAVSSTRRTKTQSPNLQHKSSSLLISKLLKKIKN